MPFDRLIEVVDRWAGERGRSDVFAQIGPTDHRPAHIECSDFLEPDAFRARLEACSVVVAHAGMGTILSALQYGKPVLVMPRLARLRETRNDHQTATARRFAESGRVTAVYDVDALWEALDALDDLSAARAIPDRASPELLARVRAFVLGEGFEGG